MGAKESVMPLDMGQLLKKRRIHQARHFLLGKPRSASVESSRLEHAGPQVSLSSVEVEAPIGIITIEAGVNEPAQLPRLGQGNQISRSSVLSWIPDAQAPMHDAKLR